MQAVAGIIGGTGVGSRLAQIEGRSIHVPTPRGLMRGRICSFDQRSVATLQRHGAGHKHPPHLVPYGAMALGLKQLGAAWCFSTAAVGALSSKLPAGTVVLCTDFVDRTLRQQTLWDREVRHTPFSPGMDEDAIDVLRRALVAEGVAFQEGTYVGVDGPRYETPTEVRQMSEFGDVVGMTASTEAIVMGEAGIKYACLALVTNPAAGVTDEVPRHEDVVARMEVLGETAVRVLTRAVGLIP